MNLLQEGQIINGKWQVERFIGEGAFAEVYRVRHRIFGRQAMKVFKRTGMTLDEVEETLQEAILLAQISHPHIVRVFDADTTETSLGICCFFTMEYVAGGTLERFWKSYGEKFVPVPTTVTLMRQVADGLALAHSTTPPIVHRDIKPQNILVGYDESGLRARVADFGLAKRFNVLAMALTGLGTRSFKPPEVIANLRADSQAGDIWALGTCFYLMLTDAFPFDDDFDLEQLPENRFERPLVAPSNLNASVDQHLDSIVYRCLALNPKDRFQTGKELLAELQTWKPGKPKKAKARSFRTTDSDAHKSAMGPQSRPDEQNARAIARSALDLARNVGSLNDAADMLEEALNKWPELREEYEFKLTLWRKGVSG